MSDHSPPPSIRLITEIDLAPHRMQLTKWGSALRIRDAETDDPLQHSKCFYLPLRYPTILRAMHFKFNTIIFTVALCAASSFASSFSFPRQNLPCIHEGKACASSEDCCKGLYCDFTVPNEVVSDEWTPAFGIISPFRPGEMCFVRP